MKVYKDNPTEALLLLSDCIEMYPNSALYLNSRAEVFKYHGDLKLAERDLNLVVQRNPGNVPFKTHKMLAELLFDREDFDNCISECKQALAVDNSDEVSNMLKSAVQRQTLQKQRQAEFEEQQKKKAEEEKKRKEQQ